MNEPTPQADGDSRELTSPCGHPISALYKSSSPWVLPEGECMACAEEYIKGLEGKDGDSRDLGETR